MSEYVVIAGNTHRPLMIDRGVLEKGMGQTSRTEVGQTINRRQDVGFPNRTDAWGKRVIRDKEGNIVKEGRGVDVKHPEYRGEIIFTPWNEAGGQLIVCRYLKGYDTIDYLYQNLVLNAEENFKDDNESSGDAAFIRLVSGDNVINEKENPFFALMLKVHEYNESSVSKSPNASYYLLRDQKFEQVEESNTKTLNSKAESFRIVNEAASDNSLAKLRNLFKITQLLSTEDVKDENLFSSMLTLADTKPDDFVNAINQYKRSISDVFEKAKTFEAIDLTKDGVVVAGMNKKTIIAEGIPGKGEEMIEWCMSDYLDAKAFELSFQLKKITDKIK